MRPERALLVAVLVVLAQAACARVRPPAGPLPAIVLPHAGARTAPFERALERRLAGVETLRGKGTLRMDTEGRRPFQCDFLLLADTDSRLRLRGTRALGPTLFELVADQTEYGLLVPPRREQYVGRRDVQEDAIPVSPSRVTDPLRIRLTPGATRTLEYGPEATVLVETAAGPDGGRRLVQQIAFSSATGHVLRVTRYDEAGVPAQIMRFGEYRVLDDLPPDDAFPYDISVERPELGLTVKFAFQEVTANVTVPAAAFDLTPPPGYAVLPASDFRLGGWGELEADTAG